MGIKEEIHECVGNVSVLLLILIPFNVFGIIIDFYNAILSVKGEQLSITMPGNIISRAYYSVLLVVGLFVVCLMYSMATYKSRHDDTTIPSINESKN